MILITGATGLVGSHLALQLLENGEKLRAIYRNKSSILATKSLFELYEKGYLFDKIEWIQADITDIPSLEIAFANVDSVFHCAALISFDPNDEDLLRKTNIEGTANMVNLSLSNGVKKVGFVSSIAALGRNSTEGIVDEECYFKATKLDSNYALSKYYAEQEVWRASQEGLNVVIVNPSVILGPGDWNKGSSQIFQKIHSGLKFCHPRPIGAMRPQPKMKGDFQNVVFRQKSSHHPDSLNCVPSQAIMNKNSLVQWCINSAWLRHEARLARSHLVRKYLRALLHQLPRGCH